MVSKPHPNPTCLPGEFRELGPLAADDPLAEGALSGEAAVRVVLLQHVLHQRSHHRHAGDAARGAPADARREVEQWRRRAQGPGCVVMVILVLSL